MGENLSFLRSEKKFRVEGKVREVVRAFHMRFSSKNIARGREGEESQIPAVVNSFQLHSFSASALVAPTQTRARIHFAVLQLLTPFAVCLSRRHQTRT